MQEFKALSGQQQSELLKPFSTFESQVASQALIPVIRDSLRLFQDQDYPQQLSRLTQWAHAQQSSGTSESGHGTENATHDGGGSSSASSVGISGTVGSDQASQSNDGSFASPSKTSSEPGANTQTHLLPGAPSGSSGATASSALEIEPRIEFIASKSIALSFDKAWLADETDVDAYLKAMREALLDQIHKGKRIQI